MVNDLDAMLGKDFDVREMARSADVPLRATRNGYELDMPPSLALSEDQPDQFGLPGIITAGGGLDEQLDTRPSATAVEPTMRDDLRVGTMNFLQEQFGMDQFQARRFSEQLIGSAGELSATPLGIGLADIFPITASPLTMQEGAQQFSEGMETGSGTDMAVGGLVTALGALEALPVFGAGFKMMNKAAQSEILREFIGTAANAFRQTGEVTQDTLIEAGEAAQARLDSMMSGTTLSANPVGAAGDAMIAGAGKVASKIGEGSGAAHARPLNPTNRSLKGINDSPDDNQPPKAKPSASSRLPQHLVPLTDDKLEAALPSTKYLVKKIREKAPDAELGLSFSQNQAGKSNYLTLTHPNKRSIEIRLSDHSTGINRAFESAAQLPDYVPEGGKPKFGQVSRESFDKRIDEVLSYYDDGIELGANKAPTAALPQTVINDNEVPSLREVLIKKSEEMQAKPAERTQPTDDQMFDVAPESYEQGIVPEMQIETPVPRAPAGAKLPKKGRTQGIVDNMEEIADRIAERARPAVGTNVQYFYHLGPLINKAQELGIPENEAREAIKEFSVLYGATSPRTQTEPNLRSATLVRAKDKQNINYDEIVGPGGSGINEAGFPMMINEAKKGQAAGIHKLLIDQLRNTGKIDYRTNPKPATFAENVGGNLNGVTVDTHAIRGALYMLNEIAPGSIPRQWFNNDKAYKAYLADPSAVENYAGKGIADTLDGQVVDGFKQQTEYAIFSDLYRMVADRLGVQPAEAQSLSWFANGEFTGLASPPKTIVELINERVDVTAQALGRSKDAIFKAFIEGKIPLMSFSGALVGVGMLEQNDGD